MITKIASPSENANQRQLFEEWRLRGVRPSLAFSVPNEAAGRNAALRRAGVMPGIPDTWWITEGQITALEMKTPGRKPTPEQDHVMALLRSLGIAAFWTDDLSEALAILEGRGVLRAGGSCAFEVVLVGEAFFCYLQFPLFRNAYSILFSGLSLRHHHHCEPVQAARPRRLFSCF